MYYACTDRSRGVVSLAQGCRLLLRVLSLFTSIKTRLFWSWITLLDMGTLMMIAGTLWASLLVYNFITALFGINTFRGKYIDLLRWLYRVKITHTLHVVSIK